MAIFLLFRKIHENEHEVVYSFGHSETEMTGRVTFSKQDLTPHVGSGTDSNAAAVARKVLARVREDAVWVNGGAYQA